MNQPIQLELFATNSPATIPVSKTQLFEVAQSETGIEQDCLSSTRFCDTTVLLACSPNWDAFNLRL